MQKTIYDIEVENLTKLFPASKNNPDVKALDQVTWKVARGSFHALLGMNGAGKTTLIGSLAGVVRPNSGQIRICGYDIKTATKEAKSSIGFVPQEPNFDIYFTPRITLDIQAGLFGLRQDSKRTERILRTVGLLSKADEQARRLSAGMRRRLSIAKAMVHDPQVLILDEPTVGVDIEIREQMLEHFRELNLRGYTIILTTHYLEEAERLCDTVTIIHKGKIVVSDEKNKLLREHRYRVAQIHLESKIQRSLLEALGAFKFTKITNYQLNLRLDPDELLQPGLDIIAKQGYVIRDVQCDANRKLEEVLRDYTK